MPLGVNIALLLVVAVVTVVGIGALLWWLLGRPPIRQVSGWTTANSFEFAKIVLALIGGIGAVVALVIAYRKQHLGEAAEQREDIKLFAERFTKAADQLGSDKAPVRLAGMYALEDLAQGTSSQRQTIVNVLCAYLRMPYLPPVPRSSASMDDQPAEPATPSRPSAEVPVVAESTPPVGQDENERRHQERQVRLTAQRILSAHLCRGNEPEHPADTFWKDIDLDLTGATLIDLDFTLCHIRKAQFGGAEFGGEVRFVVATFGRHAEFGGATFGGDATFGGAEFGGGAGFGEAAFGGEVRFSRAKFGGDVTFVATEFGGEVRFSEAEFGGDAVFLGAKFGEEARFEGAEFGREAMFVVAEFGGDAVFLGAEFGRNARFGGARFVGAEFGGNARFGGARFGGEAMFLGAKFSRNATFGGAEFGGDTTFSEAAFGGEARFDGARVRYDTPLQGNHVWPGGLAVIEPPTEDEERLPDRDGRWGYLRTTTSEE
jgi:uncharacterized protein YjbI with pentapeptide repeats